jgi:hypothetical protein
VKGKIPGHNIHEKSKNKTQTIQNLLLPFVVKKSNFILTPHPAGFTIVVAITERKEFLNGK